jgi:hypothetical protein
VTLLDGLQCACCRMVFSRKSSIIPNVLETGPGFEALAAHHDFREVEGVVRENLMTYRYCES